MKNLKLIIVIAGIFLSSCINNEKSVISSDSVQISIPNSPDALWEHQAGQVKQAVAPPLFQLDGKEVKGVFSSFITEERFIEKINIREYTVTGQLNEISGVTMTLVLRVAPDNPIVRFRYSLVSETDIKMTKSDKKDHLEYARTSLSKYDQITEVNLSEFFELEHSYLPDERTYSLRSFENESTFMGPILVASNGDHSLLLTYEHGSQLPDRFVEFQSNKSKDITISAVKGNYFNGQSLKNGYKSLWMNIGIVEGDVDKMAQVHRHHILNYMSENLASRKPYIFYNTWNYQGKKPGMAWKSLFARDEQGEDAERD